MCVTEQNASGNFSVAMRNRKGNSLNNENEEWKKCLPPERLKSLEQTMRELEANPRSSIFWKAYLAKREKDPLTFLRDIFNPDTNKPN